MADRRRPVQSSWLLPRTALSTASASASSLHAPKKIEDRLQETTRALAARNEQLYALRGDFDALTMDFWNAFARRLGCENPSETIAGQQAWQRSVGCIGTILFWDRG